MSKERFATVPRLAQDGVVVCFASGPSLTQADVDACRGRVDAAIAVNTAYTLAPWATALYAADLEWWKWHKGAVAFPGLRYSVSAGAAGWGVKILRNGGTDGLALDPSTLRTGRNSGYQALNLAVHFGAKRILLLGYDMQTGPKGEAHFHGKHPRHRISPFGIFLRKFETIARPLKDQGIEVINCSQRTALKCFPRLTLEQALALPARQESVAS